MSEGPEERFVHLYVASFLGARAAVNYEEWCCTDQHDRMLEDQPIEDAIFQARETWKLLNQQLLYEFGLREARKLK